MPIYAYRCAECGHATDILRKFSDPPLTSCPSCGAEAFQKQVTAAGFQLKGSGWYVTDFRGGAKGAKAKPGVEATAETGAADGAGVNGGAAKADAAKADASKSEAGKGDATAPRSAAKGDGAAATPAAATPPSGGAGAASPAGTAAK